MTKKEGAIRFFTEDVDFSLKHKRKIALWIKQAILNEKHSLSDINYIFCSDEYLLQLNQQYLNHNTFTDIITFNNSEYLKEVAGDIYISIERVEDNAKKHNCPFIQELSRVLIHGILHLCGYKDKSEEDKKIMRSKEDFYLEKL